MDINGSSKSDNPKGIFHCCIDVEWYGVNGGIKKYYNHPWGSHLKIKSLEACLD